MKTFVLVPIIQRSPETFGTFLVSTSHFFFGLYVIFFVVFILLVLFYFICALNFHHTFINFF